MYTPIFISLETLDFEGMAVSKGYKCEFRDNIPDYLYCNKCILVAREVVITSCCGESFCQACVADSQEQEMSCPVCGETEFMAFKQVKNERQIRSLHVYCSMKERGCVWSGTLDQLDSHLDPHLDNCQYVDTKCPLNCLQTIPKNKVDQHVAQECTKRPHVCQHCGFKATYEEVVDTHLPECKYVALQCPNMCGVSCEREVMEDHMKICRLEEVECEFSSVGCDGRFIREDQDEHARQNSQKHLTLTASLAVETKEQLQQKLLEQDKKHKEKEEKLMLKTMEQETTLGQQEKKLMELELKLREQELIISELQRIQTQLLHFKLKTEQTFQEDNKAHQKCLVVSHLSRMTTLNRNFELNNFSAKVICEENVSSAMYTHACGYKFRIGVIAIMDDSLISHVALSVQLMCGEFDDYLKWPAKFIFTVELVNQRGAENLACSMSEAFIEPVSKRKRKNAYYPAFSHSKLTRFFRNDSLYFTVSHIEFLMIR